jgi:hypothetical protein
MAVIVTLEDRSYPYLMIALGLVWYGIFAVLDVAD